MEFSSETFDFGVDGFGGGIGGSVVEEVDYLVRMFVKCSGNGVEKLESRFCHAIVPTCQIQSGAVFGRPFVDHPQNPVESEKI